MSNDELVVMGFVRGAFGVRGALKVHADTEYADSLLDYPVWWLGSEGGWKSYKLVDGQLQPKALVARLEGVDDRDQAEQMRGLMVAVPHAELPEADDGEYYWNDLIGLAVDNVQGIDLGVVDSLQETGAHDLLVVRQGELKRLIPFVEAYIIDVDLAAGRIRVDWAEDY